ncbi:hypothetical protein HKCCE2091_04870 [Rhodobacterales bacterium HKCCE2091]|nr:hypothetical protein [Rhodobacterales bacterium HKCCE2091]
MMSRAVCLALCLLPSAALAGPACETARYGITPGMGFDQARAAFEAAGLIDVSDQVGSRAAMSGDEIAYADAPLTEAQTIVSYRAERRPQTLRIVYHHGHEDLSRLEARWDEVSAGHCPEGPATLRCSVDEREHRLELRDPAREAPYFCTFLFHYDITGGGGESWEATPVQ